MEPIKIHNGEIKRMRKMLITFLSVKIQLTLQGTFIGQLFKSSNMGPIKNFKRKVRNYCAIVLSP